MSKLLAVAIALNFIIFLVGVDTRDSGLMALAIGSAILCFMGWYRQ